VCSYEGQAAPTRQQHDMSTRLSIRLSGNRPVRWPPENTYHVLRHDRCPRPLGSPEHLRWNGQLRGATEIVIPDNASATQQPVT
jgi:hypothetical protein